MSGYKYDKLVKKAEEKRIYTALAQMQWLFLCIFWHMYL